MRFLSSQQVLAIHAKLLRRWGGSEGGGHRGSEYQGVEAAIQAVKNSYYETIAELAAAYAVYIVQGHVFMDGNKRTGAMSMLTFLKANRIVSDLTMDDLSSSMVELQQRAEADERTDKLIAWLAAKISR